jgi:hypothetical protein
VKLICATAITRPVHGEFQFHPPGGFPKDVIQALDQVTKQ